MRSWAKAHRDETGEIGSFHSLIGHCMDVAAVFEALLSVAPARKALARFGGWTDLDDNAVARLAVLAGLHDAGKVNHGFQARIRGEGGRGGHVEPVLSLFHDSTPPDLKARFVEATRAREVFEWFGNDPEAFNSALHATFCHHGRPGAPQRPAQRNEWGASDRGDPFEEIGALADALWHSYPRAGSGVPLPSQPEFLHAFNGLVTLADWIASDERFFSHDNGRPVQHGRRRAVARETVEHIGFGRPAPGLPAGPSAPSFEDAIGFPPRPVQEKVWDLEAPREGSLVILEAPTGSGKTEAAFARFLKLYSAAEVTGLYFALPTRAAASQIYERVCQLARKAFGDRAPPVVLAVPGYLSVDGQTGTALPDFEVLWPDDQRERFRHRAWAAEHPKRFLAGGIVVGTVDQVLLSGLMVRHAHLRAAALSRSLLVVDEVHASDAYMTRILAGVVRRHLQGGGHVVLMSATLGGAARSLFLGDSAPPPAEECSRLPYPLVTLRSGSRVQASRAAHSASVRRVTIDWGPEPGDWTGVAQVAVGATKQGGRVLVLRNTVGDAIQTQLAVEAVSKRNSATEQLFGVQVAGGQTVPAPHHSRFSPQDRKLLDRALEDRIRQSKPLVVVATQTVEQSLDIDFDLLITDLCPADVLLQRLGRLHRHSRPRPEGFREPRVVVLSPRDPDTLGGWIRARGEARGPHGLGTVYEDLCAVRATWEFLRSHPELELPTMGRRLVEQATHPDRLRSLADEWGKRWQAHWARVVGTRFAETAVASLNLLPWNTAFGHPESLFPEHPAEAIRTRLGEEDRKVCFPKALEGPFGQRLLELTLPERWCREVPADAEPSRVESAEGRVAFRFGRTEFLYDRFGVQRIPSQSTPATGGT